MSDFYWLNNDSRLFLSRGYLAEGQEAEDRLLDISKNAEKTLGPNFAGFADKFYGYLARGFYSLATPVWTNYGNDRGLPVSCVVGDTWINTKYNGGKLAKDIEIGDEVLTHKGQYKKVTDVILTKNQKDIYKIKISSRMTPLYITGNHLVLTNLGWVRCDELNSDYHLVAINGDIEYIEQDYEIDLKPFCNFESTIIDGKICKLITDNIKYKKRSKNGVYVDYYATPKEKIQVDNDLAWALGLWFAEGSLSTRGGSPCGIRITYNTKDEKELGDKWFHIMSEKFGLKGNIYDSVCNRNGKSTSWSNANINSNIIGNFFESFGKGCKEKTIPQWIIDLPKEKLDLFLKGLLDGDGTKTKSNSNRITVANPKMLLQIYQIGLKLGLQMSLQMQEKAGKLATTTHTYTCIFISYETDNRRSSRFAIKFHDGLYYSKIREILKTDKSEDVYDFTVEDDHSFSAAGVLLHNCFNSHLSDKMQSILYKTAEVGMMSKYGGGTSGYFGDIRPRGAPISVGGTSSGAVHFMELFDKVADTVNQGNSRRGSFAAYLPVSHPDILEFLRIRSDGHPIQNMSIGVTITDDWMRDMIAGDKDKRKVWAKIIEKRFESGYPYVAFIDNINKNNPKVYKDKNLSVKSQNLCVAGDQRVVTSRGMLTAKELYEIGGNLTLFDNDKIVNSGPMSLVERMADVYEIELDNGLTHKVTSYHKVKVRTSGTLDTVVKTADVACSDLNVGDLVAVQTNKGLFGDVNKEDEAFLLGLHQSETEDNTLTEVPDWIWESNEDTQRAYIRGLLLPNIGRGLHHRSKDFLKDLQLVLVNLGINCALKLREAEGVYTLYSLDDDLDNAFHKIKSINYVGQEDVYCVTVDSAEHHWVCNGVVTHNCAEISLHSDEKYSFVCVLSSINLEHWDAIKSTDAVETLIYFLDTVNEEFVRKSKDLPFMEHPYNFAKDHRALGLGVLGWHSYLQSKMIPFDSFEANLENVSIFKTISERCKAATTKLADVLGEPDILKGYGARNTHTMAIAPTTSSSFILGQVSPSIEPLNSNYFVKRLAKGNFTYRNPYLVDLLKAKNKDDANTWHSILTHGGSVQHLDFMDDHEKNVFKTFSEISPKQVIIQAAQRQQHIDQGQSLNIMIPPGTKAKLVSDLMIFAWEQGVKSLYYQRSANPSQQLSREILNCSACES